MATGEVGGEILETWTWDKNGCHHRHRHERNRLQSKSACLVSMLQEFLWRNFLMRNPLPVNSGK